MWEVVLLAPVEEWFLGLCECDPATANRVMEAVDHLEQAGRVWGDRWLTGCTAAACNLKELRPGSTGRSEIRLLFIFDAEREAVILVAGDKASQWSRWYLENIPVAERRYEQYLVERKNEEGS